MRICREWADPASSEHWEPVSDAGVASISILRPVPAPVLSQGDWTPGASRCLLTLGFAVHKRGRQAPNSQGHRAPGGCEGTTSYLPTFWELFLIREKNSGQISKELFYSKMLDTLNSQIWISKNSWVVLSHNGLPVKNDILNKPRRFSHLKQSIKVL